MPAPAEGTPDRCANGDLSEAVYQQLRLIAQHQLNHERPGHTLQATALVNEAYVRLSAGDHPPSGARFYWAAAEAMRRILIDHARAKKAAKRGGNNRREGLLSAISGVADLAQMENPEEFEVLDGAILRLQKNDARAGDVVRLRFFGGLSVEQAAEALGITPRTAKRDWEYARAWLARELKRERKGDPP